MCMSKVALISQISEIRNIWHNPHVMWIFISCRLYDCTFPEFKVTDNIQDVFNKFKLRIDLTVKRRAAVHSVYWAVRDLGPHLHSCPINTRSTAEEVSSSTNFCSGTLETGN